MTIPALAVLLLGLFAGVTTAQDYSFVERFQVGDQMRMTVESANEVTIQAPGQDDQLRIDRTREVCIHTVLEVNEDGTILRYSRRWDRSRHIQQVGEPGIPLETPEAEEGMTLQFRVDPDGYEYLEDAPDDMPFELRQKYARRPHRFYMPATASVGDSWEEPEQRMRDRFSASGYQYLGGSMTTTFDSIHTEAVDGETHEIALLKLDIEFRRSNQGLTFVVEQDLELRVDVTAGRWRSVAGEGTLTAEHPQVEIDGDIASTQTFEYGAFPAGSTPSDDIDDPELLAAVVAVVEAQCAAMRDHDVEAYLETLPPDSDAEARVRQQLEFFFEEYEEIDVHIEGEAHLRWISDDGNQVVAWITQTMRVPDDAIEPHRTTYAYIFERTEDERWVMLTRQSIRSEVLEDEQDGEDGE